tara:strand:- start:41 stop:508 length:468 start_codon:yes stop_codon:yes gene_type:complete
MEEFKDIKGYEEMYQVSNLGNVKSLARKGCLTDRIMKPSVDAHGYLQIPLRKDGKTKCRKIHKLVADTFLNTEPCGHRLFVKHINKDKSDNSLQNLKSSHNYTKSSSKYRGVTWSMNADKWKASIRFKGKSRYLGYFTCELEASEAYENALKRIR